jgi:uncharacterized protein (DUF1800 family)
MSDVFAGPANPWAVYEPSAEAPWDLRRVVHLHRRAGFAATWDELQRDLKDGPEPSIDRVLAGKARGQGVPENFEQTAEALAAAVGYNAERLQAWWVYRMYFGPDPLGERLTLLWHDHFATSAAKVKDLAVMRRQNELLRRRARAPFGDLLRAVVHDPALLLWLDAEANRKEHPNENLARELMELFALGVGHYTEKDVKEAARALTGWTVKDGHFAQDASRHDAGPKTVLGRTGAWKGDDLVGMLLEQPATAERLAWRLGRLFLGEGAVDAAGMRALAAGLREHDLDVGWAVGTVLRSRAFFAAGNLGTRVLGPVEYVVGSARALALFDPPPGTLLLADWAARLGQELFYPPNVGGWPGGRAWVSSGSMIGRANYVAALVGGKLFRRPEPFDALGLARGHGERDVVAFYTRLLLGTEPTPAWRARLTTAVGTDIPDEGERARRLVALMLALPEGQLG